MISTFLVIYVLWNKYFVGNTQVIHKPVQTIIAGENVTLLCRLAKKQDVVQITWQKEQSNIATFSKAYGSKVLNNQSNVHLSQRDLTCSAITFSAVTFKDEGCYHCIFNTFPLGPMSGKTCLKVYALTEPEVTVRRITNTDEAKDLLKIRCLVTGRPTPIITWKVKKPLQTKPKTFVIQNANQTVTVVSSFTQFSESVSENQIICVIRHPSLNTSQELTLPETVNEQAQNKYQEFVIATLCMLLAIFLPGLLFFFIYHCRKLIPSEKTQDLLCG